MDLITHKWIKLWIWRWVIFYDKVLSKKESFVEKKKNCRKKERKTCRKKVSFIERKKKRKKKFVANKKVLQKERKKERKNCCKKGNFAERKKKERKSL